MKKILPILLVVLLIPAGSVFAFNQVNARALAMGGAQTTLSKGVQTIGWNPAFMAFDDNPAISIYTPLFNFGFRLSNDFVSLNTVNDYFEDGRYLDEAAKDDLLSEIDGSSWDFYTDFYLPVFAISFPTEYINMAISYDVGVSMDWQFSKEFVEIAFKGNSIDNLGQRRDFSDTGSRAQIASRIGLTFAKSFHELPDLDWMNQLTTGFTFNYFIGHGFGDVINAEGYILSDVGVFEGVGIIETVNGGITGTKEDSIDFDPFAGNGVGLDLGVGAKLLDNKLTVGISIINLINEIQWRDVQHRIYSYKMSEPPNIDGLNNLPQWFDDNMELVDTLLSETEDFTTEMPQVLHLNGGYELRSDLHLAANARFGLNDAAGGSKQARVGFGAEWHTLKSFPLRAGMSIGGRGGFSYGMGFGLHQGFWHTDIGWAWERGFLNSANGIHLAFRTTFFFGKPEKPGVDIR